MSAPSATRGAPRRFQLGRLALAATIAREADREALELIVRQSSTPWPLVEPPDGRLVMRDADDGCPWPAIPPDGLQIDTSPDALVITTEVLRASLDLADGWSLTIDVRRRDLAAEAFRTHLSIVLHRALFAGGAIYLHAAAVAHRGAVRLFVGDKGAGKSTISLVLGRAGATILGDDHVLLERAAPAYVVSGCDASGRVAADVEARLFATPLAAPACDIGGTLKKEFPLAAHSAADPFRPYPIDAIYFPAVGSRLAVTPLPAQQALVDLLRRTRPSFRPQSDAELSDLLAFWADLVRRAPAFTLELPRDLRELDDLPDRLPS